LRERTALVIVTPAIIAGIVGMYVCELSGHGALSDANTLIAWGGNFGPRTTHNEWWRLITSLFVQAGMLPLIVNAVALAQLGLVLERLVGRLAFATVYMAAGVFGGLVTLSAAPVAVGVGPSSAIFGLYGVLLASLIWSMWRRSNAAIPLTALRTIAPVAVVFIFYNMANENQKSAGDFAGLLGGLACGLFLASDVNDHTTPARRTGWAIAVSVAMFAVSIIAFRKIADVRPELQLVVALEDRTAGAYKAAADQFRKGRITADRLAELIDQTIIPELEAADARLKTTEGVPAEHQPLVAGAEDYLRLRTESWHLRADGLRQTNKLLRGPNSKEPSSDTSSRVRAEAEYRTRMLTLGKAEGAERASLEALQRIKVVKF
jgi:membrane associated rhomboid family serine protease